MRAETIFFLFDNSLNIFLNELEFFSCTGWMANPMTREPTERIAGLQFPPSLIPGRLVLMEDATGITYTGYVKRH